MGLSNAFDCIRHDLLIAKLHAYGFSNDALLLVYSYLENRPHKVKINGTLSNYKHIELGVPQGSVLGPLVFNTYVSDLMSTQQTEVSSYADDTTIFACDKSIENVTARLENDSKIVID